MIQQERSGPISWARRLAYSVFGTADTHALDDVASSVDRFSRASVRTEEIAKDLRAASRDPLGDLIEGMRAGPAARARSKARKKAR